jgi:Ca2+-binding RTX toxin-like protein
MPLQAHAKVVQMQKPGWGFAGMVGNTAVFEFQPWDGSPCQQIVLFTGGLQENSTVYGSSGNDWMGFITSTTSFCGLTMTPLHQNGWFLDLNGWLGDDVLAGDSEINKVFGYNGNDVLQNGHNSSAFAHGDDGNDKIFSGRIIGGDDLFGEWGDDTFCCGTRLLGADFVSGYSGTDTLCGESSGEDEVEVHLPANCSACQ